MREFVGHTLAAGLEAVVGGHIPVPDYTVSGGGYFTDDALDRILIDAAAVGARRFVLPANEPDKIRRRSEWLVSAVTDPVLYVTGIGPLGGSITDAFAASSAVGVRRAVIGRRICSAADPAEAAKVFAEEMHHVS